MENFPGGNGAGDNMAFRAAVEAVIGGPFRPDGSTG